MDLLSVLRRAIMRKSGAPASDETDTARAMLAGPVLVMLAAGTVDEGQTRTLVTEALKLDLFARLGFDRTLDLAKEVALDIYRRGAGTLVKSAVARLAKADRAASMDLACRMAATEGNSRDIKLRLLDALARDMGIGAARVSSLLASAGHPQTAGRLQTA